MEAQYSAVSPAKPAEERRSLSSVLKFLVACSVLALLYTGITGRPASKSQNGHFVEMLSAHHRQSSIASTLVSDSSMLANATDAGSPTAVGAAESPLKGISTGKEVEKSVEEAFGPSTKDNSHYVKGYNDKEVHLLVIFVLIVVPTVIYFAWKTQENINARGGHTVIDTDAVKARASEAYSKVSSKR